MIFLVYCYCITKCFYCKTNKSAGESDSTVDHFRLRQSTEEIQNLVLALLNKTIAEKLTSSILSLRETYLGTLQR